MPLLLSSHLKSISKEGVWASRIGGKATICQLPLQFPREQVAALGPTRIRNIRAETRSASKSLAKAEASLPEPFQQQLAAKKSAMARLITVRHLSGGEGLAEVLPHMSVRQFKRKLRGWLPCKDESNRNISSLQVVVGDRPLNNREILMEAIPEASCCLNILFSPPPVGFPLRGPCIVWPRPGLAWQVISSTQNGASAKEPGRPSVSSAAARGNACGFLRESLTKTEAHPDLEAEKPDGFWGKLP